MQGFVERDALLAAISHIGHVAGDCRAVADFDRSIGFFARPDALDEIRHVTGVASLAHQGDAIRPVGFFWIIPVT